MFIPCALLLLAACDAVRDVKTNDMLSIARDDAACSVTATPSRLDIRSLAFPAPNFTYLRSRELFISRTAACDAPLEGLKLLKVKKSIDAKRAQLAQRFRVKQIQTILQDAARHKPSMKTAKQAVLGIPGEEEHVPAVELHMFPADPAKADSMWEVLLVPSVREAFHETWFLCQPEDSFTGNPCIAKLPFELEPLPFHLSSLAGCWYLQLDRHRSSPARLLQLTEIILALGFMLLLGLSIYTTYQAYIMSGSPPCPPPTAEGWTFPYSCCLTRHTIVYKDECGAERIPGDPLDAGSRVEIQEVCKNSTVSLDWRALDLEDFYQKLRGKAKEKLWGRLQEPCGWILLGQEGESLPRFVKADEKAVASFRAHPILLPALPAILQSTLLLVAAHVSAQWLLVEYFTKVYNFKVLVFLVFGMISAHVLVLLQRGRTLTFSLQHEEVLQQSRKLLRTRMVNTRIIVMFVALTSSMCLAMFLNIVARSPSSSELVGELGVLTALAMHAWAMYSTCTAREKWREPQLEHPEVYTFLVESMPRTDEEPCSLSNGRAGKLLFVHYITTFLILGGLMLAARITLDVMQLRGELVDYTVNRGKLSYPAGSHAVQNTLLLDQNVDSLTLNVQLGDFTHGVMIQLHHPLLGNASDVLHINESGDQQLSLPNGPLYSRLSLLALGDYVNTTYMIHILRVGEAVDVSLKSAFDTTKYPELVGSIFEESRRLQYQMQHHVWHVPDVDLSSEAALSVDMTSLVFAPMSSGTDTGTAQVGKNCDCNEDVPGLGNMCLTEHMINLSDSTLCVYQRTAEKTLHPNLSEAGVAGVDSQVLQWLLDTRFSGKSVRLALGTDFIAEVETKNSHSLTIRFRLTRALQTLRDGGTSIQIQATQDLTSSEILDVPIQVVSTAPRPIIHVNSGMQPEYSFLLPQFSPLDTRSDYAMCGGRSDISHLGASVTDVRFEVVHTDVQEPSSCHSQQPDQRRMFRSVRRKDSGCGRWCEHYIPRAETYDIVVDRSPKECYMMAVSLQDVDALRNTRVMTAGAAENKCLDEGWLGQAIRLNFSEGVNEILISKADPNKEIRGLTPLQIAAADNNIGAMQMLLDSGADVNLHTKQGTAIEAAGSHCQIRAMQVLLDAGANASDVECENAPLVKVVRKHAKDMDTCRRPSEGVQVQGTKQQENNRTILSDVLALLSNVTHFAHGQDCKGNALREAMKNFDLVAAAAVLEGVDDVDKMAGQHVAAALRNYWISERSDNSGNIPESYAQFTLALLPLLTSHGMSLKDGKASELLPFAALLCWDQVVGKLLDLGADPSSTMGRKNATVWATTKCQDDERQRINGLVEAKVRQASN